MWVFQVVDADHGSLERGRVDEPAVPDIQSGVGNALFRAAEIEQIPGLQVLPLDRREAAPFRLGLGIAREGNPTAAAEHLRQPGAIVTVSRRPTPRVWEAHETFAQRDHFGDAERLYVERDVA